MSVFINKSKNTDEIIVTCMCRCDDGIHISIVKDDYDYYSVLSYINSNYYRDQDANVLRIIANKIKKIWTILRGKDYYYSEILMNKEDFEQFREYINSIG